ncbi:MarR family transcriptional regulator [Streptomyces sp. RB6PN25]|uniref:MarR family transcriptional regulator n=1 Tax=Streptomyces humicola TaxID=2953240 RepID=A0ABT1Q2E3_9ACTN|nr:MarR family transcriptional regulator [Streptomyces humicola]MCQ4084087.1 MarR family transcriptional regulator [Streptomyces humicola]
MTDSAEHHRAAAARTAADDTLDPSVVARLRLVIARLYRQMAQAASDRNFTFAQLSAIARVEEHGPLRLGELAARERVAAPSMTRTIAPLVSEGLIGKEPDPNDGRSFLVTITPDGRELLGRTRRERSELLARRISRLTPEQRETLEAAVPVLELLLAE